MIVEQISSGGTITYLHHDQQGSTRLLTGSSGTVTGSTTFDAYGNTTGTTGTTTTPLGYDGQYTSTDTKLIYLRARTYDPTTAQFLTVDPLSSITRSLYGYAHDNPINEGDPTGLAGSCETPAEHLERLERLRRLKEQVARENRAEAEREESHIHPFEYYEEAWKWAVERKEEARKALEEALNPLPKCYPNEIHGGTQCSSAPPGGPNDPFYPITPEP
jgi:RHS repeat-associated protein